jgi:putative ABC transport system substrate-binding protein
LGLSIELLEVRTADDIEQAFSAIARAGFDGACVVGPPLYIERARVGASVLAHRVPTIAGIAQQVPYNMLLSYGPDFLAYYSRAVSYADKILKGAKPSDLPIEQPACFKLVINLKMAKVLGFNIPPSLLVTADEIIE